MKNAIIKKMKVCVMGAMLIGTFYLLSAAQTAQAGRVLPPINLPNCIGNNVFLSWSTNDNGSVQCQDPSPAVSIPNCPAGQYISGIQNGVPVCSTAPSGSCPPGEVLVSVGGGGVTCASPLANLNANCPAGQVMVSINGGAPTCANPSPDVSVANCTSGYVMTGISNGSPVCTAASSLGGGNPPPAPSGNGKLHGDSIVGFSCDPGYHLVRFTYDCGCSNNATWFECQSN